jgi:NAD binding domain of 6-phosphogluconate dehydrogenase
LLRQPDIENSLRGKIVVQLSSGTPKEAREMDSWARRCGISYLDGAILGSPESIGTPTCTIFYSGPVEVFNRVKPVLMVFGDRTLFVGEEIGHASAFDVAVLTFGISAMLGFLQGQVVWESENLPTGGFLEQGDDGNHGIHLHRHVAESFVKKLLRRSSFARSVFCGHQAASKLVPRSRYGPHDS